MHTHTHAYTFSQSDPGEDSHAFTHKVTINLASQTCGDGDGWLIFPQKAHFVVDARKRLYSISQLGIRFSFIQGHESICFCLVVPLGSKHNKENDIWVAVELMTFCHGWYGVDSAKDSSPPSDVMGGSKDRKDLKYIPPSLQLCFLLFKNAVLTHCHTLSHKITCIALNSSSFSYFSERFVIFLPISLFFF